ncbi:MAG: retropepsin-like aspartic protease [Pseudomonadota bacterium]
MSRLLTSLAVCTALPLLTIAALALAGVATLREPDPPALALATTLLLLLPVLGFSALFSRRREGLLVGAILWPVLLLSGLPMYFPGERRGAIELGLSMLGYPLGEPLPAEGARALAGAIDGLLAEPSARPPVPEAATPAPVALPPSRLDSERDQVALPYEGRGHSLLIPVTLEGPGGALLETQMLFDTGATYTTLTPAALRQLGIRVSSAAPTITSQTANGVTTNELAILDRVWLGGFEVAGVTVAVCEACATDADHVGLLGLNVSSRFLITLDTARRELIFEPHADQSRQHLDVRPWLFLTGKGRTWPDGHTEVTVGALNHAPRPILQATAEVRCHEERYEVVLGPIDAGGHAKESKRIPAPADCDPFTVDLARGSW